MSSTLRPPALGNTGLIGASPVREEQRFVFGSLDLATSSCDVACHTPRPKSKVPHNELRGCSALEGDTNGLGGLLRVVAEIPLSLNKGFSKTTHQQNNSGSPTYLDTSNPRQGRALGLGDRLEADVQHTRLRDDNVLAQLGHSAEKPLPDLAIFGNLRDSLRNRAQFRLLDDTPIVEVGHRTGPCGRAAGVVSD